MGCNRYLLITVIWNFQILGSSRKAGELEASFLGAVRAHWAVEDR